MTTCVLIFLLLILFSNSIESKSGLITNKSQHKQFPLFLHPIYFSSHICQRQKHTKPRFCSRLFAHKREIELEKRVGWTISV